MLLDQLDDAEVEVYSVGKIFDVFLGRGIRDHVKTKNNADGMAKTLEAMSEAPDGTDFRQPGRLRSEFRASQRRGRLRARARRVRRVAAHLHGRDEIGRSADPDGRSWLRPYDAFNRSQPRIHAAAGLRTARSPRCRSWHAGDAVRHRPDRSGKLFCPHFERNEFLSSNSMSKPLMAGNWKMYKTPAETKHFFDKFNSLVAAAHHCEILICPPALDLTTAIEATRGTNVKIGAQNLYPGKEGAFTGEISGHMILSAGASHVLIGHSERRQYFGETNESVFEKTKAALAARLDAGSVRRRTAGGARRAGKRRKCSSSSSVKAWAA